MCMPSLNDICESIIDLLHTQIKMYCGRATDVKPVYPQILSGDIIVETFVENKIYEDSLMHWNLKRDSP